MSSAKLKTSRLAKSAVVFVSIQTESEYEIPMHQGGEIGIDMSIARFATLSSGKYFEPLNVFKTHKGKLAKLQRQLKTRLNLAKTGRN